MAGEWVSREPRTNIQTHLPVCKAYPGARCSALDGHDRRPTLQLRSVTISVGRASYLALLLILCWRCSLPNSMPSRFRFRRWMPTSAASSPSLAAVRRTYCSYLVSIPSSTSTSLVRPPAGDEGRVVRRRLDRRQHLSGRRGRRVQPGAWPWLGSSSGSAPYGQSTVSSRFLEAACHVLLPHQHELCVSRRLLDFQSKSFASNKRRSQLASSSLQVFILPRL